MKKQCEHKRTKNLFINILGTEKKRTWKKIDKVLCLDCNKIVEYKEEEK